MYVKDCGALPRIPQGHHVTGPDCCKFCFAGRYVFPSYTKVWLKRGRGQSHLWEQGAKPSGFYKSKNIKEVIS